MFHLIEAMGVRVVEVDELDPPVLLVQSHRLALVSRALSAAERARVADALLQAVAGWVPPPHRQS